MENLISLSAILGSIAYLIVAIEYSLILRRSGIIFLTAFLFSAFYSTMSWRFHSIDFFHTLVWASSFLLLFDHKQLVRLSVKWVLIWSVPMLTLIGAIYVIFFTAQPTQLVFYWYLVCCIGTLLIIEQHIRNSLGLVKTIATGMGTLFLFNLYLYANALIEDFVSPDIVQSRILVNTTVGLLLCFAPVFVARSTPHGLQLSLSRPLVFTTTSLVLAGAMLLIVSVLGYLFSLSNGEFASIIQPFFVFLGILCAGLTMSSSNRRAKLRVWIDKNFFKAKYNYSDEWRHLSDRLTATKEEGDASRHYANIAIRAILPVYKGVGGACFLNRNGHYRVESKINFEYSLEGIHDSEHPEFFNKMRQENWIFIPSATDPALSKFNHLIPDQLAQLKSILLILPLINNEQLAGFIVVSADLLQIETFDWEDLDLSRMVAKQVANFIGNQMLSQELVVTRQFDAYHQFTTFVMHDLKNLIAQQALVVENAARFSDNPEFVADAIKTIENSVQKMNLLLHRIDQSSAVDMTNENQYPVSMVEVVEAALTKCSGRRPRPVLHPVDEALLVHAAPDNLVMAFAHLITNAQEACKESGNIDIYLRRDKSQIECKIIDDGTGMSQDFIDHRLFKPFDSTKKNQGMGIGAYQYRQIFSNIGGVISVTSKTGEGSCFTVTLPLSSQNA